MLDPQETSDLIVDLIKSYGAEGGRGPFQIKVGSELYDGVKQLLPNALATLMEPGELDIVLDPEVKAGFRIRWGDGRAEHDFSAEAIADWLSTQLRPEMRDLLVEAAAQTES